MFIHQNPDLSFAGGLITAWGWNDDASQIYMVVREGVTWHDGSPFTPEGVVWSLERAGNPEGGNPIQFIWGKIGNFVIDGNRITADIKKYEPTIFKWMAFLTDYVMPKAYFEKVGANGFEAAPIGTGPYMVDAFECNAFKGTLTVQLHHMTNHSSDRTIQKLCNELNETETCFPATNLRLVMKLGS